MANVFFAEFFLKKKSKCKFASIYFPSTKKRVENKMALKHKRKMCFLTTPVINETF
jgi:hypothetical protein